MEYCWKIADFSWNYLEKQWKQYILEPRSSSPHGTHDTGKNTVYSQRTGGSPLFFQAFPQNSRNIP
jgi:hypothetical protein